VVKRVAALVVSLFLIGVVPAGAGGARTQEKPYSERDIGPTSGQISYYGEVTFKTRRADRFVSIEVIDDTGQKVAFDISQGDAGEFEIDGCGTTTVPTAIKGGRPVTVSMLAEVSPGEECAASFPTGGIVRATFTG
jgi:hypothetical protein